MPGILVDARHADTSCGCGRGDRCCAIQMAASSHRDGASRRCVLRCLTAPFCKSGFQIIPSASLLLADSPDDVALSVDWVNGSCLLVRRIAIEQVGLLDDAYFMYSEELDWQKRIRDAGWQVVYLPTAPGDPPRGQKQRTVRALTHIRFSHSKVRYFSKHHGALAGWLVRAWLLVNYAYEWTVEGFKWAAGHRAPYAESECAPMLRCSGRDWVARIERCRHLCHWVRSEAISTRDQRRLLFLGRLRSGWHARTVLPMTAERQDGNPVLRRRCVRSS